MSTWRQAAPGASSRDSADGGEHTRKVDCKVMDADDGVCAFALSDPTDALTVAWRDDNMAATQNPKPKCQGHCNFGVSPIDRLPRRGQPEDQAEEDPRVPRHHAPVPRRAPRPADAVGLSYPDKATKSGRTVIYEWGITPVDIKQHGSSTSAGQI